MAGFVTCPIKVLKAKLVIVAIETPLDRVRVSNISACVEALVNTINGYVETVI